MHLHGEGFQTVYTSAASHTGTAIIHKVLVGVPVDTSPTPDVWTQTWERRLTVSVTAEWAQAGDLADEIIVDASVLGFTDLAIEAIGGWATPGLSWTLEFAGASDELIYHYVADETADKPPKKAAVDFYMYELHGLPCQTTGTGDIVLTTSGSAADMMLSFTMQLIRPGPVNVRGLDHSHLIRR